jgi:hypothetical protein
MFDKLLYQKYRWLLTRYERSNPAIVVNTFSNYLRECEIYQFMDILEVLLALPEPTLIDVERFSKNFNVSVSVTGVPLINGEPVIDGDVRGTLYKLSAMAIKTILDNTDYYVRV